MKRLLMLLLALVVALLICSCGDGGADQSGDGNDRDTHGAVGTIEDVPTNSPDETVAANTTGAPVAPAPPEEQGTAGLEFMLNSNGTYSVSAGDAAKEEKIVIPLTYKGKKVTAIREFGFTGCSLSEIAIPQGVTEIGIVAFGNCVNLKSITIPDSVTGIGYSAFQNCSSLESVALPNGITAIGENTFSGCGALTGVSIPDKVTVIGPGAFYACSALERVSGCNGVERIEYGAFDSCTALSETAFSDKMRSIGAYAFRDCASIGSITIPDSVTNIEYSAFQNCTSLSAVVLSEGITALSECTFAGCTALKSITVPDKVATLGKLLFSGCRSLSSVSIGKGVYYIAKDAFDGCSAIKNIYLNAVSINKPTTDELPFADCGDPVGGFKLTIGNAVANIPKNLFYKSANIAEVDFAEGGVCTEIGEKAFFDCDKLSKVTIAKCVTHMGDQAFAYCDSLESLYYNAQYIFHNAERNFFYGSGSNGNGIKATIGKDVTRVPGYLFSEVVGLAELDFERGSVCTTIGEWACKGCTRLKKVSIPDSITEIEATAFADGRVEKVYITSISAWLGISFEFAESNPLSCQADLYLNGTLLTELVIPDDISVINAHAFRGCKSITKLTVPDHVTDIGMKAFSHCISISSVSIGRNVTHIGNFAFYNMPKLSSIYYNAELSGGLRYDSDIFGNSGFGGSGIILTVGSNVETVSPYLFHSSDNSPNIIKVSFEQGGRCVSIGDSAFAGCQALRSILLPDSLQTIGDKAFSYCRQLESISIPSGVTAIGYSAFSSCYGLKNAEYKGTTAQWTAMVGFRSPFPDAGIIVRCTDGNVTYED